MLALIIGLLFAMKAVVSVELKAAGEPVLTPMRWLGFASLWIGSWARIWSIIRFSAGSVRACVKSATG